MKFQVNCYVETCEICQRSKGHVHNFALNRLSVPAGPWEDISYDSIVKFPKCKGYDSILVVVDCFTKMMHLTPCQETAAAEDVAQMFLEHFLKALYKSLQITPSFSTAYHSQSDGQTGIKNQWLEAYLRPFINPRRSHSKQQILDVFHVSLLSAFKQDTEFDCTFTPLPPVITTEGEEEYEVDKFVDWAAEDRVWKYRVRWKGYAPHKYTWEPTKDLQHCKDKLRDFFANYPDAPAANSPIPANARKVRKGKIVKQLSKSKTARFVTLQALTARNCPAKFFLRSPLSQRAHLQLY
ncbi:Retrotransposable element Tf2 protein [Rhizoctonia solani]|uniref:Retrotransposable element Tf2 protein n=1 Tax=Rhizoctonia solani TaxID=456999 RepID=A0A8H8T2S2_9AGAM|nr:Retrotransposable element Tf2 protein [Rhizoctonia solani]QRW27806.1 Retrotransposable element Tf2 protein [Rhizoctonia solani]